MKTPIHFLNYLYHPHGFTWHIMQNSRTGQLRSQHRPHGAEPYPLGKAWTLVRSLPSNPALSDSRMTNLMFDGLETKPKSKQ